MSDCESYEDKKIYRMYGLDTAMHLLRPGARWEITNSHFSRWEDPRPCPTWNEVMETMEKIKAFEDSIDTIWLPEQIEEHEQYQTVMREATQQAVYTHNNDSTKEQSDV